MPHGTTLLKGLQPAAKQSARRNPEGLADSRICGECALQGGGYGRGRYPGASSPPKYCP